MAPHMGRQANERPEKIELVQTIVSKSSRKFKRWDKICVTSKIIERGEDLFVDYGFSLEFLLQRRARAT